MSTKEKFAQYEARKSYSTLNEKTSDTTTIWFVCHGMGQLSEYFIRHFDDLDAKQNYIIAPQAPSKYYLTNDYKRVGASWLTKLNTQQEMENITKYFDAIFKNEINTQNLKLHMLGFSQGVSVMLRYISRRRIEAEKICVVAGKIPVELTANDFTFLKDDTEIIIGCGKQDQFLRESEIEKEKLKSNTLFGSKSKVITYDANHRFDRNILKHFI